MSRFLFPPQRITRITQNVLVEIEVQNLKYLAVPLARKIYFQAQHVACSNEQQGLQEVCA